MPEVSAVNNSCSSICTSCSQPIRDQYIYKVTSDMQWHEECLKCVECDCKLIENATCFVKNGKPYCKNDYLKLFSIKCDRCLVVLKRNDLVMKSKHKTYHFDCFFCDSCNKKLLPGDEYQMKEESLNCKECTLITQSSSLTNTTSINTINSNQHQNQIYVGYTSMSITPDSLTSFSPSTNSSTSSSNSMVDSPLYSCNSSIISNQNYQYTMSINQSNMHDNINNINSNEDENSISDNEIEDDDDGDEDDADNSMSEESLNDSLKMNKKQKSNGKLNSNKMKPHLNYALSGNSLLQINTNNKNMHNNSSGSSKPARIRTVLNEKQLQTLRACYGANPRPDALMKEQLVEMTGLNPRVIRVWFQNKRCKDKKKNMLGRTDQPMALPLHYNSNPLNNFNNPHLHNHNHHHHMVTLNNPHPSLMYDNCY